ncbi:MAG TPA: Rieske 2Fe-2S domain-containing protein [Gemmatimonadaceae bacterium]|nr:Rieske 2Fe-2S domain-containing protein [Gemmatimonadaceae bacterium]
MHCKDCSSRREFLQLVSALGFAALPILFVEGVEGASEQRYPFPAADSVTIDRKQQVMIVRNQGHVYAFNLSCPHENTALKWLPKDNRFQCPKHESKYQPNGTFMSGRATRNMDRLSIRRDGNDLVVDLSHIIKSDADPDGWSAATIAV